MKKFLSLVLAMIMTLSLVTISAGATEYKDLTDKDEIQYEEAVAVLNRIGVITGYEDGTFRPETELTRGAAAKIIVSLMIGPDAANALPNTTSPYPDVPAGHTFAGVISYCKTAEYISGYGDGTFRPAGTLTGYAFAKMLLGALGYKSNIEGFVDTGWTNNVARVGNIAGLFDRISFDGAAAVTRDQACQLALNTLKGTLVTYGGTTIINGGTAGQMTMQGTTATPITSNNRDINANIGRKDWYGGNNQGSDYLTLEFGEEHFKDLRLEHDRFDPAHDQFGRPSNEWSYKKVTIGTFPLPADFTYTTQVAHVEDTASNKEKALGLRNYDLQADGGYSYGWDWVNNKPTSTIQIGDYANLWMNGKEILVGSSNEKYFATKDASNAARKVAEIADLTDNGTLVEVYVSYVDADWITDVVVIQTQLMEIDKVASDYVSLDRVKPDVKTAATPNSVPNGEPNIGYNLAAIDVEIEDVKDNLEDSYNVLKELKSGDTVAVVPVTTDGGKTYEAAEVYVPETVSGAWTRVDTYGDRVVDNIQKSAITITVGGTEYKIADWNKGMYDKSNDDIKATRKDVTLLMDKYGNALRAKGIGDTSGFMVIGNFYQSLVNGKLCTYVHGWDISGSELDLNLGSTVKFSTHSGVGLALDHELGELVRYSSKDATGDADYALTHEDVHSVFYQMTDGVPSTGNYNFQTKTNDVRIPLAADNDAAAVFGGNDKEHFCNDQAIKDAIATDLANGGDGSTLYRRHSFADRNDVKFIYVNYDRTNNEVESVEFKTGRQNATTDELATKCSTATDSYGNPLYIYASQASVDEDGEVTAVVIKRESADASLNHILYVTKYWGFNEYDREAGIAGYGVTVARFTDGGKYEDEVDIVVNKNLAIGSFASYTDLGEKTINGKTVDHYYRVTPFTRHNSNPAVLRADYVNPVTYFEDGNSKKTDYLLQLQNVRTINADGKAVNATTAANNPYLDADPDADGRGAIDAKESYLMSTWRSHGDYVDDFANAEGVIWSSDAEWLNMTGNKEYDKITSTKELNKYTEDYDVNVTVLFNENPESNDFRVAYLVVINSITKKTAASGAIDLTVDGASSAAGIANSGDLPKSVVAGTQFTATLADGYSWDDTICGTGLKIVSGDKNSKSITFEVVDPKGDLKVNTKEVKDVEHFSVENAEGKNTLALSTAVKSVMDSTGAIGMFFNVTGPDFAVDNATLDGVTYALKANGETLRSGPVSGLQKKAGVQSVSIAALAGITPATLPEDWTVEIDATDVSWSKVHVNYNVEPELKTADKLPMTMDKGNVAATVWQDAILKQATYDATGNTIAISGGVETAVPATPITNDNSTPVYAAAITVTGKDYVNVDFVLALKPATITGLADTKLSAFTNKTGIVAADNNTNLKIDVSATTTADGTRGDAVAVLSAACSSTIFGYKVTLKVSDDAEPLTAIVKAASAIVPLGSFVVTEDTAIVETMVTVEAVGKVAPADDTESPNFTVNGADFTVTFDRAITLKDASKITTTLAGAAVTNVSVSGNVLSFSVVGKDFGGADSTIVIDAAAVESAVAGETGNTNVSYTLSYTDSSAEWALAAT